MLWLKSKVRAGFASLSAVVLVGVASSLAPVPAHAQFAVTCVNCSTNLQQLVGYAKQLEQAITEANQLQQQIQMYENMALNTANLPQQLYGNIASDLNGVNTIMGRVQGISYAASNLDSVFSSHFPGYQAYSAQPTMSNMTAKYQQWSNDMNTSTHSVFSAAQAQNSQMTSETQLLNSLQQQNMSAQGRQQSAQIANELSAQQVAQMQKLRQLVMLQMQQEGTFLQTQSDQDAQRAANGAQAMQPANLPNSGNTRY